jgi:hypothetical protein|nr:MAG TPA: hypothetical protein [Caudoviricetes sp.]
MAINLPRKYSRETLDLLKKNEGTNLVMTPGAIEVATVDLIDKSNQLVTKQSVLDIFNRQVLDRINLLPKYSRDYFFINSGNIPVHHDENVHRNLMSGLGNAHVNNDYGFMCMHDYVKLSDFRDKEGEITYDDLANTFSNVMKSLSRLSKLHITIKKGNKDFYKEVQYAISTNFGLPSSYAINYAEVRNQIINSRKFNDICYRWFSQIIVSSLTNVITYTYKLPDPDATSAVKWLRSENYFGRVGIGGSGDRTATFNVMFGEADAGVYFKISGVTRNLKGFTLRMSQWDHQFPVRIITNLINAKTEAIIATIPHRGVGGGNNEFVFPYPVKLSGNATDDLILRLGIKVSGDTGDGTGLKFELIDLLFDDEYSIDPTANLPFDNLEKVNTEIIPVDTEYSVSSSKLYIKYKYVVKNQVRKFHSIYTLLQNSVKLGNVLEGVEVWRNGNLIGTNSNTTIQRHGKKYAGSSKYRQHTYGYNVDPVCRNDISQIDVQNGDEILFIYNFAGSWPWQNKRGAEADRIVREYVNSLNLRFKLANILYKSEAITR